MWNSFQKGNGDCCVDSTLSCHPSWRSPRRFVLYATFYFFWFYVAIEYYCINFRSNVHVNYHFPLSDDTLWMYAHSSPLIIMCKNNSRSIIHLGCDIVSRTAQYFYGHMAGISLFHIILLFFFSFFFYNLSYSWFSTRRQQKEITHGQC